MPTTRDTYSKLLEKIASIYEAAKEELSPERRNATTLSMYWEIGKHIVEIEQDGQARAQYGSRLIPRISTDLTLRLGSGFSQSSVLRMRQYFNEYEIPHPGTELTWSHYKALMSVKARQDRALLERRAIEEGLSKNTLLKLARELNGVDTGENGPSSARALRPRKGQLDIVKVVEIAEGPRTRLMLDCGFRVLAGMPRRHSTKLLAGEYLRVSKEGDPLSARRISCEAGERYCYRGFLQRVVDGDTVEARLDLALGGATLQRLRLRGVNAPELGTGEGEAALRGLKGMCGPGDPVTVLTYHHDVHGRYVADLFLDGGVFINMEIIKILENTP